MDMSKKNLTELFIAKYIEFMEQTGNVAHSVTICFSNHAMQVTHECISDELHGKLSPAVQPSLPGLADGPLFEQQMGRSQRPVDMAAAGTVKDWSLDRVMTHTIRQEGDEYACRCGRRWDVSEGNEHP